jgi:sodium-dependent dicarboxylate transporter 2/3/5
VSKEGKKLSIKIGYRDSRRAAARILHPGKRFALRRVLLFVAVTLAAVAIWHTVTASLPPEQRAVLLLFLVAVGLWVTEAVPAFAVGLLIMGYLVFALGTPLIMPEPWDVDPYLNTWSSPVIWLMLGGFFMAEGLSRTGLDRQLFAFAIKPAGSRPDRVLLAIMLTSAVASMFISNTSTAVLMIGAVLPLVRQMGSKEPFSKALLIAIPVSASVGGMGTIIGSAPNAIAAGVAAESGATINFLEWMVLGVPVALVLVVIAWFFLVKRYPTKMADIKLDMSSLEEPELPLKRDRIIVTTISLATVALWMTTPLHGIHIVAISLIPIVGLTMTQVMGAAHVRRLPWDTLMLVAGGLSLGSAVVDSGLAERFATQLGFLTSLNIDVVVFAGLALITIILSNVMSNTATVSIVLPVAVALLPGRELEMCLILGLSASCALLLPVSTPPNAIAYSTGELQTSDLRPGGILIGLLGPALIIGWVLFLSWLIF